MKEFKDYALLALLFIGVIALSPILIPLFIIDDIREDNFYRNKAEYYQRYF